MKLLESHEQFSEEFVFEAVEHALEKVEFCLTLKSCIEFTSELRLEAIEAANEYAEAYLMGAEIA